MGTMNQATLTKGSQRMSTSYMIKVAIFSAIAFVVMYLEFPMVALFPPYLQIDLSDAIAFIGGVTMGPLAVILIELVKNLLHLMLRGGTGGVGELANFMVGVALILPAVMIYRARKTIPSLFLGFVVGVVSMILVASIGNWFIFLPFYGVASEDMMSSILKLYVPFNAVKGLFVGATAIVLHQGMKGIYKYIM